MQCGNGLMHESVRVNLRVDEPADCTRPVFEWANAMAVATVEVLLPGVDCDVEAQALHLRAIRERESLLELTVGAQQQEGGAASDGSADPADLDLDYDPARFFERLEQTINTVSSSGEAEPEAGSTEQQLTFEGQSDQSAGSSWVFDPASGQSVVISTDMASKHASSYSGMPFVVPEAVESSVTAVVSDPASISTASTDLASSSSSSSPATPAGQQHLHVLQSPVSTSSTWASGPASASAGRQAAR
jgi:hypothetical protein